jgi:hypothetical protein
MKYLDCSSCEIEIPSLQEDSDGFLLVDSKSDLELLVVGMGWRDLVHFESETECSASCLIGRWFQLLSGVNFKDGAAYNAMRSRSLATSLLSDAGFQRTKESSTIRLIG